ncbi:hypothetical protein OC835_004146 [Tilletia horrida]|nr:hypothetical protein OC835_004146 [Tilletia horrida]
MSSSRALVRAAVAGASDAGATSLRGQTVLAEEDYIHSVSTIIARDFFPDLDRLKAENEYLDALQSGDEDWIEASVRALVRAERKATSHLAAAAAAVRTPARASHAAATPTLAQLGRIPPPPPPPAPSSSAGGAPPTPHIRSQRSSALAQRGWDADDTPVQRSPYANYPDTRSTAAGPSRYAPSEANDGGQSAAEANQPPADTSLSLSAFQRAYTSEDNASFGRLLQLNAMKRRERYAWAYKAEEAANQKRIIAEDKAQEEAQHGQRLAIAAAVEADPSFQKRLKGKERLLIEAGPSSSQDPSNAPPDPDKEDPNFDPNAALKPKKDDRPASFPSWRFTARNAFHFGPDANINTFDRSTSSLPTSSATGSSTGAQSRAKEVKADQPVIRLHALRMPDLDGSDSALRREGGLAREPDSPSSSRIDAAIAGKSRRLDASSVGDSSMDDSLDTASEFASPRINGYGFVTPLAHTPREESVLGDYLDSIGADDAFRRSLGLEVFDEEGEQRVQELKRWGRENVPVRPRAENDKDDEDEVYDGSFRVPPTPKRDEIGRRLAQSKVSSSPRHGRGNETPYGQARYVGPSRAKQGTSATLGSSTPRSSGAHLSPAAKLLLQRTSKGGSRLGDTLLRKRAGGSTPFGGGEAGQRGEEERKRRRADVKVQK